MSSDCHIWAHHSSKVAILKNVVVYHSNLNDKPEICSSLLLLPKYQIHIKPCILTACPIHTHTHTHANARCRTCTSRTFMTPVTRRKGSSRPKECHSWPLEQAPWSKINQALVIKGHALGRFALWASSSKPHKTGIK